MVAFVAMEIECNKGLDGEEGGLEVQRWKLEEEEARTAATKKAPVFGT